MYNTPSFYAKTLVVRGQAIYFGCSDGIVRVLAKDSDTYKLVKSTRSDMSTLSLIGVNIASTEISPSDQVDTFLEHGAVYDGSASDVSASAGAGSAAAGSDAV